MPGCRRKPLERERRKTDAYRVGIVVADTYRHETSLVTAIGGASIRTETLEDPYPAWHPAPYDFEGMLRILIYHKITAESYQCIAEYPELADEFDLKKTPGPSVLSRTWRERFDDDAREFVETAARFVVKQAHDYDFAGPEIRPTSDVTNDETSENDSERCSDPDFSDEEIVRTTRLAREHAFGSFDSGRARNATYEDVRFLELQTFMGMVGCGTAQGAARFQYRRGTEYGPHGDTHLRAVKQFTPEDFLEGFDRATDRVLSGIASEASFRRPVTVAIDITTLPYYGRTAEMPMVSGTKDGEGRAFKFATLSIIGWNIPLVLAVEPVRESSSWDDNPPNRIHRVVRRLVLRAKEHVPIETVLCDREFDSMRVFQTLSNLDVNYLIPKRITSSKHEVIDQMDEDDQDVAVESASIHVEAGSHPMRFLYVPSTSGEGTTVFATNLRVEPNEAETFCRRYSRRWQIENEYKSIKGDFLAKTSSTDYRVRLFYFVFAVLLYNIWRLTDFLLKAGADVEMDYAPVVTAGECVEIVVSALIPPD